MTSHSTHVPDTAKDASIVSESSAPVELSPIVKSLLAIAEKKYSSYMKKAEEFDDSLQTFSSTAVNQINGARLTNKIVLASVKNVTI